MKISSSMPANASAPVAVNKSAVGGNSDPASVRLMQEMQEQVDALSLQIIRNIAGIPDPGDAAVLDQYAQERRAEREEVEGKRRAAEQCAAVVEPTARIVSKHAPV